MYLLCLGFLYVSSDEENEKAERGEKEAAGVAATLLDQ